MRTFIALITFIVFSLPVLAQTDYSIRFDIKGLGNDTVYLANYFGQKLYYADTTVAKKGVVEFKSGKELKHGMYAAVLPGQNYFEFIFAEDEVHMKSNVADITGAMEIVKSKENKLFYDYINYLNNKKKSAGPLREQMQAADEAGDEAKVEALREELKSVDTEVKEYQHNLVAENKGMFIANMININLEPEIPELPKKEDGTVDSTMRYTNYKNHYLDNVDFTDGRMVRTPVFHNKIDYFFNNVVVQNPDSVIKEADRIISLIPKENKEMYQYIVHYITFTFETSKIMGMDRVFVHMALNYYDDGKAHWLAEDKAKKIVDRAKELQPLLIGEPAHPLSLLDTTGQNWKRLYDIEADYTILIFWDPDCGHCKKVMPKYGDLHRKLKDKGVSVYGVSSSFNEKWKKFIREKELDFINVALPQEVYDDQNIAHDYIRKGYTDVKSMNFRTTFDVYATPKIFVLDEDKKIIAKQLNVEQIEDMINRMIEGKSRKEYEIED